MKNIIDIIRIVAAGLPITNDQRLELILFLEAEAKKIHEAPYCKIGQIAVSKEVFEKIHLLAVEYNNGSYHHAFEKESPKITAIKLLRQVTGYGLREANEAIESIPKFIPKSPNKSL